MPRASRIVSEWMLVGFHLGRAPDAFDPDNGLPGDELLRAMLLRRLAAALTSAQSTRSITYSSGHEAEDLERLWAEQRTQYSPSTLSDDPTDCRLVLVHQGLLRIEAWLRACDDVFEPASSTKLGFDLGIELGHSFAIWTTPFALQRSNRRQIEFQFPKCSGKSRQGTPVFAMNNTASTKRRLSLPGCPGSPTWPDSSPSIRFYCSSVSA